MAVKPLNRQQKSIVNPYPKEQYGANNTDGELARGQIPSTVDTVGGHNGNYNYRNARNNYVIARIQDGYIRRGKFLQVGQRIGVPAKYLPNVDEDEILQATQITASDILAYVALYPQNGIVKKVKTGLQRRYRRYNPRRLAIVGLSAKESNDVLLMQAFLLEMKREEQGLGSTSGGETVTTEAAQDPENQKDIEPADIPPSPGDARKGRAARLSSLPPALQLHTEQGKGVFDRVGTYDITRTHQKLQKPGSYYFTETDQLYIFTQWTRSKDSTKYSQPPSNAAAENEKSTNIELGIMAIADNTNSDDEIISLIDGRPFGEFVADMQEMGSRIEYRTYLNPKLGPASTWVWSVAVDKTLFLRRDEQGNFIEDDTEAPKLSSDEPIITQAKKAVESQSRYQCSFEFEGFDKKCKSASEILKQYHNIITKAGYSFKSKLNLNYEADLVRQFADDVGKVLELNVAKEGVFFLATGKVEFKFSGNRKDGLQVESFYYDGVGPYAKGMGLAGDETENVFKKYSPQTYGFLFSINALANEDGSVPWTQFLQEYVIPYVDYKASNLTTDDPVKLSKIKNKDKIFKTKEEASSEIPTREKLNQMGINSTTLYNQIRLSSLDCDTLQGQAMRNFLRLYKATISKTRWKDLTKLALVTLRDELIKDQAAKMILTDAARYSNNPNLLEQDAERLVNESLYCILDALGDNFERKILDPMGLPPSGKDLIRNSLDPPKGIRFSSASTVDFYRAWRNQTRRLLINYMGQILMGTLSDVLKAGLQCGPDEGKTKESLRNSREDLNYGALQINDQLGDVDLLEVAGSVPLLNKRLINQEDGTRIVETYDPTESQIKQLNNDVSSILLPRQVLAILDGDAAEETIDIIRNMINGGPVDMQDLDLDDLGDLPPLEILLRQESLRQGDVRYAVLGSAPDGFSNEDIIRYFSALGDAMDPDRRLALGDDVLEQTPDQAFCANNESFTPPEISLFPDMSPAQVESQLDQRLHVKTEQALSMCDMLKGFFELQIKIDDYRSTLEPPGWYKSFLEDIENVSRRMMKMLGSNTTAEASQGLSLVTGPDIENTILGQSLLSVYPNINEGRLLPQTIERNGEIVYFIPFGMGQEAGELTVSFDQTSATISYYRPLEVEEVIQFETDVTDLISQTIGFWSRIRNVDRWGQYTVETPENLPLREILSPFMQGVNRFNNGPGYLDDWLGNESDFRPGRSRGRVIQTDNYTLSNMQRITSGGIGNLASRSIFSYLERLRIWIDTLREDEVYLRSLRTRDINPEDWFPIIDQNVSNLQSTANTLRDIVAEAQSKIIEPGGEPVAFTELAERNISGTFPLSLRNKRDALGNLTSLPGRPILPPEEIQMGLSLRDPEIRDLVNSALVIEDIEVRKIVANTTEDILSQIAEAYITTTGQQRIQTATEAINSTPFTASDRTCVSEAQANQANAALAVIQSRVVSFFTNVLPICRVYFGWNTPDTMNLLANYLTVKLEKELDDQDLYSHLVDALPSIEKMYQPGPRNERGSIVFSENQTDSQKIQQLFLSFLLNVMRQLEISNSPYGKINLSSLGSMELRNQYYNLVLGISRRRRITPRGREGFALMEDMLYHVPVPLLIALQIIFYDKNIELVRVAPNFWKSDMISRRAADNALKVAFDPSAFVSVNNYENVFPVVFLTYLGNDRTYYNVENISRRINIELFREYESLTREYNSMASNFATRVLDVVQWNNAQLSDEEISWQEAEALNNPNPNEVPQRGRRARQYELFGPGGPWRFSSPSLVIYNLDTYLDYLDERRGGFVPEPRSFRYLTYLQGENSSYLYSLVTDPEFIQMRSRLLQIENLLPKIQEEIATLQEFLNNNSLSVINVNDINSINSLAPYPFVGRTTIQEQHAHEYSIDFRGNGVALEAVHPDEPRIAHVHQIVNWEVREAASSCWREDANDPQSCQSLYNIEGASPHIHYLTTEAPERREQEDNPEDQLQQLRDELERIQEQIRDLPF